MPRTRGHLDREQKVGEVLDRAEAQLLTGGYGALSIAELARELGLAQNAIYWYFPTKDHLFVAAVRRLSAKLVERKPRQRPVIGEILWFLDRLSELQSVRRALDDRARVSTVVAEFDREYRVGMRAMLRNAISGTVAPEHLETSTDALFATLEGVLLLRIGRDRRERIVRYAFDRLVS